MIKFAVSPGQALKLDDIVCVIETDKVRGVRLHSALPRHVRDSPARIGPYPSPALRFPSTCAALWLAF